ncbi:MAG TPA: PAS domain S-box protein [Spirochaetota bacterium]|mgnify:CR=1 FL=1|nr:PAS domain S-box protein [Spirochaetota bacterium]
MKERVSSLGADEDRKLAFSFGALILVLMLIVTITGMYLYSYQQIKEETRLSTAVAGVLSESISKVNFSGKYHTRLFVEEIKRKVPVLESISVETFEGEIIAHSNPGYNDTQRSDNDPAVDMNRFLNSEAMVAERTHDGVLVKEIIVPFREGLSSSPAGIIRIAINVDKTRWWLRVNRVVLFFLITALTSAAMFIVFKLSGYFGGRVRDLALRMLTILDNSPALIYMKDFEGRYLFINRKWEELFNTTNDEVKGKKDSDIFTEDIANGFITNDRYVMDNGSMLEIEEYALLPDGMHSYQSIKVPIKDSAGKIYALCGISTDVTERKKSEAALKESEEQHRVLIDLAPDPFFHGDSKGNLINVNNAALELTEYTRDELIGMNIKELFPDDVLNSIPLRFDLLEQGLILKTERTMKQKNGGLLTIEMNSKKMPDGTYQSFFRDITRRKQAEEALKESEEIFRNFMENSPIYVFFKDEEIRSIRLSRNFEQMLGRPLEEMLGKTMDDLFPSDLAKSMIEDDKKVLEKNQVVTVDEELNGRYYTTIKFPVLIDDRPRYLAGYTIDITERILSEKLIDAERERLLVTLRSIGDAVITTDTEGKIILMNRVAEALTGWQLSEAQGRPLMEVFNIINEITREPGENPARKVINSGDIIELPQHTILINRDGSERLIADSGAPIRSGDSSIAGIVLVFRDITEKRNTELLLQNSQKLESLGVLAGGIAHDFNNLLSGIFGYMELMKLHIKNQNFNKLDETLNKSIHVFERTKALTQQLLTFAKGGEPHKKQINLSQMLVSNSQFALSGTGVSSRLDIQPELWYCIADENQIGQVLDNIIINAVQAMPEGGEISISASNYSHKFHDPGLMLAPGRYVCVEITDHGQGIPREHLSRIFDPFFTTKPSGNGLGLATAYSIIKRHAGSIEVTSSENTGTTFTIYLPAADEKFEQHAESPGIINTKLNGKVLIMDDEDFVRNTASGMLISSGIYADSAANGEEAETKYREAYNSGAPYSAVILDLTVKGGTGGRETIKALKKINPDIIAIASSGYSADPVMANPAGYGFTDRLIKPYRLEELLAVLNRAVNK